MAMRMKTDRFEMVDSWEIRIGQESIVHRFGRRAPASEAVKMAQTWLDTFGAAYAAKAPDTGEAE